MAAAATELVGAPCGARLRLVSCLPLAGPTIQGLHIPDTYIQIRQLNLTATRLFTFPVESMTTGAVKVRLPVTPGPPSSTGADPTPDLTGAALMHENRSAALKNTALHARVDTGIDGLHHLLTFFTDRTG